MKKLFSEIKGWVQKFWEFLQRENLTYLVRVLLILGVFVLILSIGVYFIEHSMIESLSETEQDSTTRIRNPFDVIWWIIVTVTTVGYGDKFPQTIPGRFLAVFVIVYGTTVISVINSFIVNYISDKINKQNQGLGSFKCENHIILCEWNSRSKMVVKRLRYYSKTKKVPIVLIADIDKKPIKDDNLFFVKGQVNEENLDKANLKKAKMVIILGDDNLDYKNRDVKVVSSHLTIEHLLEKLDRKAHTIVELVNEKEAYSYQELVDANEIIRSSKFTSYVIAHSTIDRGIRKVIYYLLNQFYDGNKLKKIPLPTDKKGEDFISVFKSMKKNENIIIVAIQQGKEGKIITNPSSDYKLTADDYLIAIADHN